MTAVDSPARDPEPATAARTKREKEPPPLRDGDVERAAPDPAPRHRADGGAALDGEGVEASAPDPAGLPQERSTSGGVGWDEAEPEEDSDDDPAVLRQARHDAELTVAVDPVRAYLKRIGTVALLGAAQEVELATRIEAGLLAAERLRGRPRRGCPRSCAGTCARSCATGSARRTAWWRPTCGSWSRWPNATPAAAWRSWT